MSTTLRIYRDTEKGTASFKMNGNQITLSLATGAITSLRRAGCPEFVDAPCSLVDLAYPIHLDYDPLRLSPIGKYHPVAPKIATDHGSVIITWRGMAMNINLPESRIPAGEVKTTVTLSPNEDGQSIDLRCTVKNGTDTPVRQILFPDLSGLAPVSGEAEARFTTTLFHSNPYAEQSSTERTRERFYGENRTVAGQFFSPAGLFAANGADRAMGGRWFDFGSLKAGISLYRQVWGWGPENMGCMGSNDTYWVKLNHTDRTMRIASMQYLDLKKGETYDSGVYVLTPHAGGWVNGIEPYRAWVKKNQKRVVPVPQCMKEWMGFRTIWMGSGYPKDKEDANWTYRDFPALAKDVADAGLSGMNLWGATYTGFPMTKDCFYPEYGGFDAFRAGVLKAAQLGVEIYPLVSMVQIWYAEAVKRGLPVNASWAETIKAVPVFRAPYMKSWSSYNMGDLNVDWWREAVMQSLRFWRDEALCPSIAWDQYVLPAGNDALHDLINEYRLETQRLYPDAHFSAESTFFMESDIDNCDSQWTWLWWQEGVTDFRPYLYAVETERPNMNVDSSPLFAKYIFMDNLMMNAYPSKPGCMNGSAMIADYPEFAATLKRLSALRRAYLPYFTDGGNIGDCALTKTPHGVRTGFYTLDGGLLGFAVLDEQTKSVNLSLDISAYTQATRFVMEIYDENNTLLESHPVTAKTTLTLKGEPTSLFVIKLTPAGAKR